MDRLKGLVHLSIFCLVLFAVLTLTGTVNLKDSYRLTLVIFIAGSFTVLPVLFAGLLAIVLLFLFSPILT